MLLGNIPHKSLQVGIQGPVDSEWLNALLELIEHCPGAWQHVAVGEISKVGHGGLERVHGQCNVTAVEMAAMQELTGLRIQQGVVIGTVEFAARSTSSAERCSP